MLALAKLWQTTAGLNNKLWNQFHHRKNLKENQMFAPTDLQIQEKYRSFYSNKYHLILWLLLFHSYFYCLKDFCTHTWKN